MTRHHVASRFLLPPCCYQGKFLFPPCLFVDENSWLLLLSLSSVGDSNPGLLGGSPPATLLVIQDALLTHTHAGPS